MVSFKRFIVTILVVSSISMAQAGQSQNSVAPRKVMNGECSFSLVDPYSGRLEKNDAAPVGEQHSSYLAHVKKGRYIQDIVIYFGCMGQANLEKICKEMADIEFDGEKWMPARRSESINDNQSSYVDPMSVNLDETGTRGGIYAASDASGPVKFRQRSLSFCLTNGTAVVWGSSIVDTAPYSAKKSTESEVIRLIRSVRVGGSPK